MIRRRRKLYKAGVLGGGGLPAATQYLNAINATSPDAWWPMDEESGNRTDSIGSLVLTDTNTVTFETGLINNAAHFTKANAERLRILEAGTVIEPTGTAETLGCWVKFDTTSTEDFVFGIAGSGSAAAFILFYMKATVAGWRCRFYHNTGAGDFVEASNASVPSTDTWYFITCGVTASKEAFFRVNNGAIVKSSAAANFRYADTGKYFYTGWAGTTPYYLDGALEDVMYWQRFLSDAEHLAIYNKGVPLIPT